MRSALFILLIAAPAFADSSPPEPRPGSNRVGRCVERMERARDELARAVDARYRRAVVEAVAIEASEAGDPTSRQIVDSVTLKQDEPPVYVSATEYAHYEYTVPQGMRIITRAAEDCMKMMKKAK
jgi:hypothetical protein